MKKMLLCLLVALPCILNAEEFVAPQAPRREISTQAPELNPSIEGMVKFFLNSQKPWQALNPAAPAEYGSGEKMSRRTPHLAHRTMQQPSRLSDSSFETSDYPIAKANYFVRN